MTETQGRLSKYMAAVYAYDEDPCTATWVTLADAAIMLLEKVNLARLHEGEGPDAYRGEEE